MTESNTDHAEADDQALEARRRLRRLRQSQGLSVEELAARIERSPSSVRAHENGQNGISRTAAALYATALGVSPGLILWGTSDSAPNEQFPAIENIPVIGELAGDAWFDGYAEQVRAYVSLSLPEYAGVGLRAFVVSRRSPYYRKGDYVVVAPVEVGVRHGDHLVVRLDDQLGRTKLTLMEVQSTGAGIVLISLVGGPDRLGIKTNWNSLVTAKSETITVIGPVVAYGGRDRPASGPIITSDTLGRLSKLA